MMILLVKLGLQPYQKDTKMFEKMAPRRILAKRKIPLWAHWHGSKDNDIKLNVTKIVSGCKINLNVK
jgi:hypothetical protein